MSQHTSSAVSDETIESAIGPLRVETDDLNFFDSRDSRITYRGLPFTGVGYDLHPAEGYVVTEEEYRDGFESGWVRNFYPDGRVESEYHREFAVTDGPSREWHPDGRLKAEGFSEHNIPLWDKEWDEQGNLTRDWHLTEDDPQWAELMRWREAARAADKRAAVRAAAERKATDGETADGTAA